MSVTVLAVRLGLSSKYLYFGGVKSFLETGAAFCCLDKEISWLCREPAATKAVFPWIETEMTCEPVSECTPSLLH